MKLKILKKVSTRQAEKGKRVGKQNFNIMDEPPICPEWWPRILWDMHFIQVPWKRPSPINYPPAIDAILSALVAHTSSYMLLDEKVASEIRAASVKTIVETAKIMGKLHNEAVGSKAA